MAKLIEAIVVSNKMTKTLVVKIDRTFRHRKYKKVITKHKKLKVHSEDASIQIGDVVIIKETKPISKDKHFILVKKIGSGKVLPEMKQEKIEVKQKAVKEDTKTEEKVVENEEKLIKVAKPKRVIKPRAPKVKEEEKTV